jgi:mannonate dehydratase
VRTGFQAVTSPGHGVDIDEALAARFPYRPVSLPVNRLEDGIFFNW